MLVVWEAHSVLEEQKRRGGLQYKYEQHDEVIINLKNYYLELSTLQLEQ